MDRFNTEDITIVGLDTDDGPEHPLYDPRAKDRLPDARVLSILREGPLVPALLREAEVDGRKRREIIDGRDRLRAVRAANLAIAVANGTSEDGEGKRLLALAEKAGIQVRKRPFKLDGLVVTAGDERARRLRSVVNEQRRANDPLRRATEAAALLDSGQSEVDVAVTFGVSKSTIATWKRLLTASPAVLKAVASGQLSATAAAKLAKLTPEEQGVQLESLLSDQAWSGDKPTVEKAARAARSVTFEVTEPENPPPTKRLLRKLAEGDAEHLGLKPEVQQAIRWVLGQVPAETVPTLGPALTKLDSPPPPKDVE